ncbi:MAG: NTP transferase domain-containing protein [Chloroflexi bacterium]|nr:NTP transferase domain-containing protein [Chloroflexota bacterium]MCC6895643.1 NTP transferase domain-containing protein [Anaerolineae bacterium]
MDAIILAGGKGTRMQPLTATTPKPLLKVQGRPILEWSLLGLPPVVDRVIVVINYLQEQVEAYMQAQHIFPNYLLVQQQPQPLGTGHAIQMCEPHLHSDAFMVINGDDLYSATSLSDLAAQPLGILGASQDNSAKWGVLVTRDHHNLDHIHEKPPEGTYPLPVQVNAGAYKFDRRIFDHSLTLSIRGEYEITDYVSYLANLTDVTVVESRFWFPIGTPQDLEAAQNLEIERLVGTLR